GLKGSLNEYELDLLRQRSLAARHEKARRGELIVAAPIGYVKTNDERLEKDPDRRVQEVDRPGVCEGLRARKRSPDIVVVPGARSAITNAPVEWRPDLETPVLCNSLSASDEPDLRWRLCLRKDQE